VIIKRLYIHNFGKLKNIRIDLSQGFNVIYGGNETGKSTVQAFIKAMLYGLNSQKKSIRENDRKRYLPWSGEPASGELYFEDDKGNEYVIKRTFGSTRREDTAAIFHCITGINNAYKDEYSVGRELFGIGEEAFEKTLFIRQLGAKVERDKEDEIMKRLINLSQSGDENVSYYKAVQLLSDFKRKIIGNRKAGQLEELNRRHDGLLDEKRKIASINESAALELQDLKILTGTKEDLLREIEALELERDAFKQNNLLQEYKEINKYAEEIEKASNSVENLQQILNKTGSTVTYEYVEATRNKILVTEERKKALAKLNKRKASISEEIQRLEVQIKASEALASLDGDAERKIALLCSEKIHNENKLDECSRLEEEIRALNKKFKEEKLKFGVLEPFGELNETQEKRIFDLEERIKERGEDLAGIQKDEAAFVIEAKDAFKRSSIFITAASAILLMIFLLLGIFKSPIFYLMALPAVFMILRSSFWKREDSERKKASKVRIRTTESHKKELIYKELQEYKKELSDLYEKLGVTNLQEFTSALRRYNSLSGNLIKISALIEEKNAILKSYKSEEVEAALEKTEKYLDFILKHCGAEDIAELNHKIKNFKIVQEDVKALEKELRTVETDADILEKEINSVNKDLEGELRYYYDVFEEGSIDNIVVKLYEVLKDREALNNRISSLKDMLQTLLKGRDIDDIESKVKEWSLSQASEQCMEKAKHNLSEDEINILIGRKNKELIQLEKSIKDIENSLLNKHSNSRKLFEVEEEINMLLGEINISENKVAAIKVAEEVINEAFEEIQKSFGPRLNNESGDILKQITAGKYTALKVSQNYDINVMSAFDNAIKDIDYFSNGTYDQVYFSLRMAIIKMIFEERKGIPVILDDAFTQYDDLRLEKVLQYLHNYSFKNQVILFTCQKREVLYLESYRDVSITNI
jgi:DNA repair protein SbcC/Rad50